MNYPACLPTAPLQGQTGAGVRCSQKIQFQMEKKQLISLFCLCFHIRQRSGQAVLASPGRVSSPGLDGLEIETLTAPGQHAELGQHPGFSSRVERKHPREKPCPNASKNSSLAAPGPSRAGMWRAGEACLRAAIAWGWMGSLYPIQPAGSPRIAGSPLGPAVTHACHEHVSRWIMNPGRRRLSGTLWILFALLPRPVPPPSWQPRSHVGSFPDAEWSQGSEAHFPNHGFLHGLSFSINHLGGTEAFVLQGQPQHPTPLPWGAPLPKPQLPSLTPLTTERTSSDNSFIAMTRISHEIHSRVQGR